MIAQNAFRSVRNSRSPLTMDQLRQTAPSIFAQQPYHGVSAKYAFIPTVDVVEGMIQAGFQPFAVAQARTRIADKRDFTKHMIRFRQVDFANALVDETFPEVVLVNGHDRSTKYKLMGGLFRMVCSNGMIIADSLIGSVSVMHYGNVIDQVTRASAELIERMPKAIEAIREWRTIDLTPNEQGVFAEAAHIVRFGDAEGKTNTPITPKQLLEVRRHDDNGSNLWSVFNRVQENALKGGLQAYNPRTQSNVSSRAVKGIDGDVKLNRALWTLAEGMAAQKKAQ